MKYRVHVYAVVRIAQDVEAESPTAAIKIAEKQALSGRHSELTGEFADDVPYFLVDVPDAKGLAIDEFMHWYDGNEAPDGCELCNEWVPMVRRPDAKKEHGSWGSADRPEPVERDVAGVPWKLCASCGKLPEDQLQARVFVHREKVAATVVTHAEEWS